MIAVYYYDNDTPFQMYVLKLTDEPGEHHKFLEELEKSGYPFPTADVLFIESDKVVDQWNPSAGAQRFEGIDYF